MKLSIVELGNVAPDTTEKEALVDSLETARHADSCGFNRIWFAEHHVNAGGASHHPELLIAAAAMKTDGIRIGSGGVLLNHYSPFKVAEMFKQLEALAPGRVDLGMGRATAGPIIDLALQREREHRIQADHAQQILEVLAWLYDRFPNEHPFSGHKLLRSVPEIPQTWLLGSSPNGSQLAAGLGIGYTFAGFINPAGAASALRSYREDFAPQGHGLEEPRAILAVNVAVADTEADGLHLASSAKGFYARLGKAGRAAGAVTVPHPDDAVKEMSATEKDEPTRIVNGRWPRFVAGSPDTVRATLEQMLAESQADELMVQDLIAQPDARRRNHALLAETFGLSPRS